MKTNPIANAARAKGTSALIRRVRDIRSRYGATPAKMDRALLLFLDTMSRFNYGASLPLTAVTLARHRNWIVGYLERNVEFVVHGYTHIDYTQLEPEQVVTHLKRARGSFAQAGISALGFRSPYLRTAPHLYAAIEEAGFSYVSSQPVLWDALHPDELDPRHQDGYRRALDYYAPWDTRQRVSLPRCHGKLIEIPVSLPDDEILLDRLDGGATDLVDKTWRRILSESYRLGELFTMQLHPERMELCASALSGILAEAAALAPTVWVARLDEIATWWRARTAAVVETGEGDGGTWHVSVSGPPGTTILTRGVEDLGSTRPWANDYWQSSSTTCTVRAARRPSIGLSPGCPLALASFLRQQGYVCEVSHERASHGVYLDEPDFGPEDERPLLVKIEESPGPLVRLGRWPDGARSALCVTGDIDALTIWDYALRAFGK